MISFGVMPDVKKGQDCVYCDSSQMFYIYSYNGKIYNGQFLNFIPLSRGTRFDKVKSGDVLTLFVDNK
jgi:hypothetical protein